MGAPYRQHIYLGEYASDALALAFIQANKWDTLGTGLGLPQNGMYYYNTTDGLLRRYATPAGAAVGSWGYLESQIQYDATKEPTGWERNGLGSPTYAGDFSVSFNNAARTFRLDTRGPAGSRFYFQIAGKRYNILNSDISPAITDTEGLWYCYYDSSGVLTVSQAFWDLSTTVPVATVYWDSTNKIGHSLSFEGHGCAMDWKTHLYLHLTVGARFASGLALGNYTTGGSGNNDTDAECSLSTGTIFDEDIEIDVKDGISSPSLTEFQQPLSLPAQIPIYYRNGVNGNWRVSKVKQIATLQAGGYVNCVLSDIGKTVLIGGVASGALLWFDNTNRKWLIDYWTSPPAVPIPNASALTISTGTGSGTTTGSSVSSGIFPVEHGQFNSVTTPVGDGRIRYNRLNAGSWSPYDAQQGYHVAMWLFATNEIATPIIAIMGQREDNLLSSARTNNSPETLSFGSMPFHELKVIWRLIFQTSSSYSNSMRAKLVDVVDYRTTNSLPASSYVATDHASLSGRSNPNQHPASAVAPDTTNFGNLLSPADDDVQKALDTIDDGAINKAGTVAFTANQSMGNKNITSLKDPSNPQDAATKNYVDSLISGYRVPVYVLKMVSDANQGGAPPVAPSTGDAYVVNNWGGLYSNNDILEYNGAAWVTVMSAGGGAVPNGTRVVVKSVGSAGSFAGQANKIAQYNSGTLSWDFTSPNDGDVVAVMGENSQYENHQYIYDAGVPAWIDFGSSVAHNSTTGKEGPGPEYYHMSSAQFTAHTTGVDASGYHNHDGRYPRFYSGATTPEGNQVANPGDTYLDTVGDRLYMKKTGVGNTGWGSI